MIQVFGHKPKGAIYLGDQPYSVRNDCAAGQWKVGDDDFRGKEIEISIIKVSRYFGTLGKATNTFWLQVWFIPAPSCAALPKNTVCLTYLKTRSLTTFSQKITELMESGEPAEGIFKAGFQKHSNEYGAYFSVDWDWRERTTPEEQSQLEQIAAFLQSDPPLFDLSSTKQLVCIDSASNAEIAALAESASHPALPQN